MFDLERFRFIMMKKRKTLVTFPCLKSLTRNKQTLKIRNHEK